MKKLPLYSLLLLVFAVGCGPSTTNNKINNAEKSQAIVLNATQLADSMKLVEELEVIISGTITDVCQMSGCWLELDMGNGNEVLVTFPEDVFVVPGDAIGKQATVTGLASKVILPVKRLQLQAADEGATEEEINAIVEPVTEYSIAASQVIVK